MSVGVLIITHDKLGTALVNTTSQMLDTDPSRVEVLGVPQQCDPDQLHEEAKARVAELNDGEGVLVLTDMYGSTPSNIATRLDNGKDVRVIAGVNLPMLVRIFNYPQLGLPELTRKAVSAGKDGVHVCDALKRES